jgi:hypothetical protein
VQLRFASAEVPGGITRARNRAEQPGEQDIRHVTPVVEDPAKKRHDAARHG